MSVERRPKDADLILAGTRGWISIPRMSTDLASWLQFKFGCSRSRAERAASWAQEELKRLGEPYDRATNHDNSGG